MTVAGPEPGPFLDFPVEVGGDGALRTTGRDDHLRDLIMEVLFTEPGERVNLPEFGCGLKRLVFAPSNEVLRATTQFLVSENLQRWLADRIEIEEVTVSSEQDEEEVLRIEIAYAATETHEQARLEVRL